MDEPRDCRAFDECLALLERVYPSNKSPISHATLEDAEMTLLVAAWFGAHPHELQRTLSSKRVRESLRLSMD